MCFVSAPFVPFTHGFRSALKSARLPDPMLGSHRINSSEEKGCGSLRTQALNELAYGFRRMQMRPGSHFPSVTSMLAVQTHMFGAKCGPSRERTVRGWKMQPCPKVRGKGAKDCNGL